MLLERVELGARRAVELGGAEIAERLVKEIERQMKDAAKNLEFEEAAKLRDEIRRGLGEAAPPEYEDLIQEYYRSLLERHENFLVLDLHSYNHRRDGPDRPPANPQNNPQVNIGTGTMIDRDRWAALIERFMDDLAAYEFPGGRLDVRENVKFRGGALAAWTHRTFPDQACVLSVEVKKFFMDEWTGEPDAVLTAAVGDALQTTLAGAGSNASRSSRGSV